MLNIPLLVKTLEHIEAHPEEWDQQFWAKRTSCGTSYCFAGWAVVLGGETVIGWWSPQDRPGVELACELDDGGAVGSTAAGLLGLYDDDADRLFAPKNTLDDLRTYVAEYIAEAEAQP